MKKLIMILFCLTFLSAHTCDDDRYDDGINCTMEARAALNVTVTLGDSSENVTNGITVTATDGDFTEVLQTYIEGDWVFSGAYERPGNYTITVTCEGYQTYISQLIPIARDQCHVIPRQLQVNLQPI